MDVLPALPAGRQVVQRYGQGGFTVSGVRHEGSIVVMADRVLPLALTLPADLAEDSLAPLLEFAGELDLVLLGTGTAFVLADGVARAAWRAAGLRVEPMATPAACRTYNVLVTEGRRVAAALLVI